MHGINTHFILAPRDGEGDSIQRRHLASIWSHIIKIRLSHDRPYIDTAPKLPGKWSMLVSQNRQMLQMGQCKWRNPNTYGYKGAPVVWWSGARALTRGWPLEDVAEILKVWFCSSFYEMMTRAFHVKLLSWEYYITSLMISQHWLR